MERQYGYTTQSNSSNTATTTSFTITKTKGIKVELAKILEEYVKLNKRKILYIWRISKAYREYPRNGLGY